MLKNISYLMCLFIHSLLLSGGKMQGKDQDFKKFLEESKQSSLACYTNKTYGLKENNTAKDFCTEEQQGLIIETVLKEDSFVTLDQTVGKKNSEAKIALSCNGKENIQSFVEGLDFNTTLHSLVTKLILGDNTEAEHKKQCFDRYVNDSNIKSFTSYVLCDFNCNENKIINNLNMLKKYFTSNKYVLENISFAKHKEYLNIIALFNGNKQIGFLTPSINDLDQKNIEYHKKNFENVTKTIPFDTSSSVSNIKTLIPFEFEIKKDISFQSSIYKPGIYRASDYI
jgi:hypothetical protein